MKLLSICIPTYKRPDTLHRCINSIVVQIQQYGLEDQVDIYVVNDASPDNTAQTLTEFESLNFFRCVNNQKNLGMNMNFKTMFNEIKEKSTYQLIITDDDYLQPDILNEIVEFLSERNESNCKNSVIWTPRYSYTDDGNLHTVVCKPFKENKFIAPSLYNVGKYMSNGFVLSGLIIRAKDINYDFWDSYKENAYFPVLFFGDLMSKNGAYFWNKNIVHHTVLNECHWESWGENDMFIELRLYSDFIKTYQVMANNINSCLYSYLFYLASFLSIYRIVNGPLMSNKFAKDKQASFNVIDKYKSQESVRFNFKLRLILVSSLISNIVITNIKLVIFKVSSLIVTDVNKKETYQKKINHYSDILQVKKMSFRLIA